MNQPRKNLANSVLARAEAFRRGTLFDGVPAFTSPGLELPAAPANSGAGSVSPEPMTPTGAAGAPPAAVPGAADALTAGAVMGNSPLETMLQP